MEEVWEKITCECGYYISPKRDKSYPILCVNQWREKKNNKRQNKESMGLSHSKHYSYAFVGIYACAILYPLDSNRLWAHHASEVPRDLIAFEFVEGISRSWHLGALEVSEDAFCCCKYLCFCFLFEYIFDGSAYDLSFLSVVRFIWEVWRYLDFMYLTWLFWMFKNFFENFKGV